MDLKLVEKIAKMLRAKLLEIGKNFKKLLKGGGSESRNATLFKLPGMQLAENFVVKTKTSFFNLRAIVGDEAINGLINGGKVRT